MSHKKFHLGLTALVLFAFHLPASAAITCCTVDGKRVCGDPAPPQCLNKARTEMRGGVARQVEAPLTAGQRAEREAEEARLAEEKRKADEQARRDKALLASYANEGEIDRAMRRALVEIEKNAEQAKNRLEAALDRQKKLEQEKEFYANKPLPPKLQSQIKDNEAEIAAQQAALKQKDDQVEAVKARYAADKERYRELTGKR